MHCFLVLASIEVYSGLWISIGPSASTVRMVLILKLRKVGRVSRIRLALEQASSFMHGNHLMRYHSVIEVYLQLIMSFCFGTLIRPNLILSFFKLIDPQNYRNLLQKKMQLCSSGHRVWRTSVVFCCGSTTLYR